MKIYAVLYKKYPTNEGYEGENLNVITVNWKISGNDKPCLYVTKQAAEEFCSYMNGLFRHNQYFVEEWDTDSLTK